MATQAQELWLKVHACVFSYRTRRWRSHLPLLLSVYSPARRLDIEAAIKGVIVRTPRPWWPRRIRAATDDQPLSENGGLRDLPETVPEVYGVYGAPRSGKDVFAAYLQAHYKDVEVFNFSDGIIAEVNLYLRHHRRFLRTHVITESNKSQPHYRHLLQAWGQARREENVSHWVDAVKREARARTQAGARLVVIAGARVPSDVDAIYELKGVLVRILRPGNTYERAHDVEGALDHWPEASFLTIVNDVEGDLSAFEANIEAALRQPQPAAAPD